MSKIIPFFNHIVHRRRDLHRLAADSGDASRMPKASSGHPAWLSYVMLIILLEVFVVIKFPGAGI